MEKEIINSNIHKNRIRFLTAVLLARYFYKLRLYDLSAHLCQAAAHFAWLNFTGEYCSSQLEYILSNIARKSLLSQNDSLHKERSSKNRVLHVLTKAPAFGGCPKFVRNWILLDHQSEHSIFLTQSTSIPNFIRDVIDNSHGNIYKKECSLIKTAIKLRNVTKNYDYIILHIHPYDIVPNIAFANDIKAKVLYNNHADHVFWIGLSISDLIINLRRSGEELTLTRRNAIPVPTGLLPIPLEFISPQCGISYSDARKALNVSDQEILCLSIASEYKYSRISSADFIKDHVDIIKKNRFLKIIVIGPQNIGDWKNAYQETCGRLEAIGPQKDLELYRIASDVIIDSYPFSSLTAMLESMIYGKMGISHSTCEKNSVARFDDIAFEDSFSITKQTSEYRKTLETIRVDDFISSRNGSEIINRINKVHCGDGWRKYLSKIYNAEKIKKTIRNVSTARSFTQVQNFEQVLFETQKSGNESYDLGLCYGYEILNAQFHNRVLLLFFMMCSILLSPRQISPLISYFRKRINYFKMIRK